MAVDTAVWLRPAHRRRARANSGAAAGSCRIRAPICSSWAAGSRASPPPPPATRPGLARCCSSRPAAWARAPPAAPPACSPPRFMSGVTREPFVDLARASLARWGELQADLAGRGRPGGARLDRAVTRPGRASPRTSPRRWSGSTPARWRSSSPAWRCPWPARWIRHQARVNPLRALARLAAGLPAVCDRRRRHRGHGPGRPGGLGDHHRR